MTEAVFYVDQFLLFRKCDFTYFNRASAIYCLGDSDETFKSISTLELKRIEVKSIHHIKVSFVRLIFICCCSCSDNVITKSVINIYFVLCEFFRNGINLIFRNESILEFQRCGIIIIRYSTTSGTVNSGSLLPQEDTMPLVSTTSIIRHKALIFFIFKITFLG